MNADQKAQAMVALVVSMASADSFDADSARRWHEAACGIMAGHATKPTPSVSNKSRDPITGSINEAVEATGLSRSTLYEKIKDGTLQTVKFGGRTLVRWDSLRAMILGNSEAIA